MCAACAAHVSTPCTLLRANPRCRSVSCLKGHAVNKAVRRAFRHSKLLQMLLLGVVVLGCAMTVGDGILTPSVSVLGAVSGLKVATDDISQGA